MSIGLFGGNTVVLNTEPALRRRRDLGSRRARGRASSSASSATRWRGRSSTRSRTATTPPMLLAIVSGGAILSPAIKAEINERLPNVMVIDAFGASETGANGAVDVTDKGPRFRMNEWTTVITDDGKHGARSARSACWPGVATCPSATTRTREKTAATFVEFDGVRWAIPGDRAVIEDDGDDHRARPRFAVHQHGRREGVPRRGRGGAEEPPRRVRRDRRRRARPRFGEAVAAVVAPREGTSPTLDDARRALPRRARRATRCRGTWCSSTRSSAHPPASPTTAGRRSSRSRRSTLSRSRTGLRRVPRELAG